MHKTFLIHWSMKKKIIMGGIFALTLLIATGYGVNVNMRSNAGLSELALSNVEALAEVNINEIRGTCTGSSLSYCFYRCCACAALHQSQSQGDTYSVKGECGVCGAPVEDCR